MERKEGGRRKTRQQVWWEERGKVDVWKVEKIKKNSQDKEGGIRSRGNDK